MDIDRALQFDEFGRRRPRNREEAQELAQEEFIQSQIEYKKDQINRILEIEANTKKYQSIVDDFNRRVAEENAKKIDYLGEMDAKARSSKQMRELTIPQSLRDLQDRYERKIEEAEEKYNATWGTAAKEGMVTAPKKPERMEPIPTSLIATLAETRSTGELKMFYDRVLNQWHETFPKRPVPDLKITVTSQENLPFSTMVIGHECHLTPLALGMTPRALRKLFVRSTPDFVSSQQRLIDSTDTLYFTPQRLDFVLAKAISEASIGGPNRLGSWAKLKLYGLLSRKRYVLTREKIEMKTDTMAAHLSPAIAIGGIEHLAKLNGYYEYFQHDVLLQDDSVMADVRLMNLLNVAENVHGIKKSDSLRLALNNRVTLSGSSRNLVGTVNRSLDSKLLKEHIAKHYPKTISVNGLDDI